MKNIIKGVIYGVFSVCPGLSGGMLALKLGDYYKFISIINYKDFTKDNIIYLLKLVLGFILGVISLSNLISYLYGKYQLYFNMFVLLITIYLLINFIIKSKISKIEILLILFLSILICVCVDELEVNNLNVLFLFFVSGFVYSFSKIIPGISGTSILINLGFYKYLLEFFSNPLIYFENIFLWTVFILVFLISSFMLIRFVSRKNKLLDYFIILIMLVNMFMLIK